MGWFGMGLKARTKTRVGRPSLGRYVLSDCRSSARQNAHHGIQANLRETYQDKISLAVWAKLTGWSLLAPEIVTAIE